MDKSLSSQLSGILSFNPKTVADAAQISNSRPSQYALILTYRSLFIYRTEPFQGSVRPSPIISLNYPLTFPSEPVIVLSQAS